MGPAQEHRLEHDGTSLCCLEWGAGPPVLLLHGLAGYAGEWEQTASWLAREHRVLAPDQRGHGSSGRRPADLSRAAFVADAAAWIEGLGCAPAAVCGQLLGGHTALLLAARRPELVRALVVAWPARPPIRTRPALRFFGGRSLWARAWAGGLEPAPGGLRPRFDLDVMEAALREVAQHSYWDEWASIACPALVVRAGREEGAQAAARMLALLPAAHLVEIAGAGHDVHLDRPRAWRAALGRFLAQHVYATAESEAS